MTTDHNLKSTKDTQASLSKKESAESEKKSQKMMRDFILTLILPMLVNKVFMMYFGMHYALYPGEGYGYGLATTIFVMLGILGYLIWKYRNYNDE